MTIISGLLNGATAVVESAVFQRTVDHPDEFAAGYHVVLADGWVNTAGWDQVGAT